MGEDKEEVVIFSSRMGEIQRTQQILESLATGDPVSPAKFSLSVHNAIAGQWSLTYGVHKPLIAIAPFNCSPIPALLEAYSHLANDEANSVCVAFYEEAYPRFYDPFISGPPAPTALAMKMSLQTERLSLIVEQVAETKSDASSTFVDLSQLLQKNVTNVGFSDLQSTWQIRLAE